jgi:membrane-associated phospholipid phosphatase
MSSTTATPVTQKPHGIQEPRRSRKSHVWISAGIALWILGLAVLAASAYIIRHHPAPWPIELSISRAAQHFSYWPWFVSLLAFVSTFNNPTPTGIALGVLFTWMLLMGWFRQSIFFALCVGIGNALNALIGDYVQRPRPSPKLIHVDAPLKYNSFPSGHCNHMMVYYGFLLFLSFSGPVRHWRYRWLLIPLQLFAALNIALMGYARLYEGEHWIGDVLAGYLSGALWLALFICLYLGATKLVEKRRERKHSRRLSPPVESRQGEIR